MELPKRVLIGYRHVDIKVVDLGMAGDDGQYLDNDSRILINELQKTHELPDTLLHELLHAIWDNYELGDDDKEEKIVTVLAHGLIQLFLTNPEVLFFLQGALDQQRGN